MTAPLNNMPQQMMVSQPMQNVPGIKPFTAPLAK
jgi:hypothetical protein